MEMKSLETIASASFLGLSRKRVPSKGELFNKVENHRNIFSFLILLLVRYIGLISKKCCFWTAQHRDKLHGIVCDYCSTTFPLGAIIALLHLSFLLHFASIWTKGNAKSEKINPGRTFMPNLNLVCIFFNWFPHEFYHWGKICLQINQIIQHA